MKILLLGQVPAQAYRLKNPGQVFAPYQPQAFWLKALKGLGHRVKAVNYTGPVLLPETITSRTALFSRRYFPRHHARYRRYKSDHYQLFPDNLIRSHQIVRLVRSFKPRVVIVSGGISELTPRPFLAAKALGARILLLHGVHPMELSTKFETGHLDLFDSIITNDPVHAQAWLKLGAKSAYALPYSAIDPSYHRRLSLSPQDLSLGSQVTFVGTLFPDRQKALRRLTDFDLKIYGDLPPGSHLHPALKSHYFGTAYGQLMVKIFNASKIVLNFVPPHMPTGGNLRTFEIPGCGAFQLASRCHPAWFKSGEEIVLFTSLSHLRHQIAYYLDHQQQRQAIASAGHARTHRDHTYANRFTHLLKKQDI